MKPSKTSLFLAIFLVAVGVGWLLTSLGIAPRINWLWTLGLAVAGIMTFTLSGIDKVSLLVGSFFLLASVLSILRQVGAIEAKVELPILVISLGILLLIARSSLVPPPAWVIAEPKH